MLKLNQLFIGSQRGVISPNNMSRDPCPILFQPDFGQDNPVPGTLLVLGETCDDTYTTWNRYTGVQRILHSASDMCLRTLEEPANNVYVVVESDCPHDSGNAHLYLYLRRPGKL